MKLFGDRFFLPIILCILTYIFVSYRMGRKSYLPVKYWFQENSVLKWLTSDFNNTGEDLENRISVISDSKNHLTSVTNRTLGPHIITNLSTTDKANENISWYLTALNINIGRLGNQMFIYASLLGIALRQGRKMFIKPGSDLEKTFKLQHVGCNETITNWTTLHEAVQLDPKLMQLPHNHVRVKGYLLSFLYFSDIMDIVKQEFTFRDTIAKEADTILSDVRIKHKSSLIVGVHVRRGDFLKFQHLGYGVPQKSYFVKAFDWMRSIFPGRNIIFFIASDDLKWCKRNLLGDSSFIMPSVSHHVHMAILSKCEHLVISGGSYGWWSGWLSGGHVVYYTGYMAKGTVIGDKIDLSLFYPPLWIGMGN